MLWQAMHYLLWAKPAWWWPHLPFNFFLHMRTSTSSDIRQELQCTAQHIALLSFVIVKTLEKVKSGHDTMVDEGTKKTLSSIPLLKTKAGPRDKELWVQRLKEEYQSLIQVIHFLIEGWKSVTAVFLPFFTFLFFSPVCAKQQGSRQRLVQTGV